MTNTNTRKLHEIPAPVERVLITGMGALTPLAGNCAALYDALFAGQDSIAPVEIFDASRFLGQMASTFNQVPAAGLSTADHSWMDRATFFAVAALHEAMAQAGLEPGAFQGNAERVAVCLGSSHSGLVETEAVAMAVLNDQLAQLDPRKICATLVSHCTAVVKRVAGAKGRVITISSACASSNTAVGAGADLIRNGEADVVIAGGADTVSLSVMAGFNALRALSSTKTAPFSTPSGLNIGEGAGIVILESETSARKRGVTPLAEVLGYGLSGDAHHATAPDSTGAGAEQAMREALASANLVPHQVDYVNAHGTGTEANDSAESQAMLRVFGQGVVTSSLKSYFGHTLGASGVLELISTILMAQRGYAPHGLRMTEVRPGCAALNYIADAPRQGAFNTLMVNNYGFGGNNSSLLVCLPQVLTSGAIMPRTIAADGVVVTGVGTVSAAGTTFAALAQALAAGVALASKGEEAFASATSPALRFTDAHLKPFARCAPSAKFGIAALEAALGADKQLYDHNPRLGLICGSVFGAQKPTEKFMESVFQGDPALANAHYFPMITMNANGGAASLAFGITGYTTTLCGSAAALCYALDLVRDGRQDRISVLASDEVTPRLLDIYHRVGALDVAGAPAALGEGACALALERAQGAQARQAGVLVRISGWAHFQDCLDLGVAVNGDALHRAIVHALSCAGLQPADIGGLVTLDRGPAPVATSVRRALSLSFGVTLPPVVADPVVVIGYTPSGAPLWTVAAAMAVMMQSDSPDHVMALGADLVGDAYAIVVSRSRSIE
jgi:3-oxoacyl-[acyl-carrier-protein] synthase II